MFTYLFLIFGGGWTFTTKKKKSKIKPLSVMYLELIAGLYSGHFALNSEMEIAVAYFVSHTQQEKKKM